MFVLISNNFKYKSGFVSMILSYNDDLECIKIIRYNKHICIV